MTRAFFDTNILIYLFDISDTEKKSRAQQTFDTEVELDRAILSTQVLQEFYVNATRKLTTPLPLEEAEARVRDLSKLPLVQVDSSLILAAITRRQEMPFSFWDALIVEAALKARADRRLMEDLQHGQVIDGMRVENPFL